MTLSKSFPSPFRRTIGLLERRLPGSWLEVGFGIKTSLPRFHSFGKYPLRRQLLRNVRIGSLRALRIPSMVRLSSLSGPTFKIVTSPLELEAGERGVCYGPIGRF